MTERFVELMNKVELLGVEYEKIKQEQRDGVFIEPFELSVLYVSLAECRAEFEALAESDLILSNDDEGCFSYCYACYARMTFWAIDVARIMEERQMILIEKQSVPWRKMPRLMLAKCAEAVAFVLEKIRK